MRCRSVRLVHQNIRGLPGHTSSLEEFLSRTSGLSDQVDDHHLDAEFKMQRKYRQLGEGGGVIVYLNNSLNWHQRFDIERDTIECIWNEI